MIKLIKGNIFKSDSEAIVNAVNCVGVMGKGIALEFKNKFPLMYLEYKQLCKEKKIDLGKCHIYYNPNNNPKYIINFPTTYHYKSGNTSYSPQNIEYGLIDLVNIIKENNIKSISIPALGCGCGKLEWNDVKQLIIDYMCKLDNVDVILYEPIN